ncbi:E3 SUMO-protein ligase ZBED1-like [Ostrea edulis]|uniref:E3 SUMO-protein ligase ZBED1-like n=1 Tax=Ostrea edulis TaxID=37623 RepID=UPI0024AF2599|nr:E3 SUMO-protein ligase ZBED1-like [Ostrea edulis]
MSFAVCKVCRKTYANKGNTTNFKNHIDSEHGGSLPKNMPTKQHQPSIDTFVNSNTQKGKLNVDRQHKIDDSLNKLIVGKVIPISIVENVYFRDFVALLEPRYKIPSRFTVISRLEKKKEEIEAKLNNDLESVKDISITHDGWTSLNTESYFTTTIHYIDRSWELQSAVLGTVKMELSHTSENIANSLQKTQLQWKLPQPIATSDNAANEVKAYEILGWSRFGCYGHRINLIVKHSLLVKEVDRILGKSRKLVTFFHKSSSVTEMLLSKQKLLLNQEQVGHKLIIDVATRWNSTLYMLQRLVEQTPVLMALANDPDLSKTASNTLKNCVFSFQELSIVEKLVELLSPFEKATTILCADKYPTMHKVLPVITKLLRIVELNDEDLPFIKHIKQQMQLEMDKRAVSEDISVIACMMNPFMKDLNFASNAQALVSLNAD